MKAFLLDYCEILMGADGIVGACIHWVVVVVLAAITYTCIAGPMGWPL